MAQNSAREGDIPSLPLSLVLPDPAHFELSNTGPQQRSRHEFPVTPTFEFPASPTRSAVRSDSPLNWKEREAAVERGLSLDVPPPAYDPAPVPPHAREQNQLNPNRARSFISHLRVSSIMPTRTVADGRKWYERKRNVGGISAGALSCLAVALLIWYFALIVPHREASQPLPDADTLAGNWNITNPPMATTVDDCAAKSDMFVSCAESRFKTGGMPMNFYVTDNNGTFTADFAAGVFDLDEDTDLPLRSSSVGLQTKYWYDTTEMGKLSMSGCEYGRGVQMLLTTQNGEDVYHYVEIQLVQASDSCTLSSGSASDKCSCTYIGNRS